MATFKLVFNLDSKDTFNPLSYLHDGRIISGQVLYPDAETLRDENPAAPTLTKQFDIAARRLVIRSENSIIYRASLNQGTNVILKFAVGKEQIGLLHHQAGLYINQLDLKWIPDDIVPKLHGVLKGTLPADKGYEAKPFVCLVLEDCGARVTGSFEDQPDDVMREILEMFVKFHRRGYHPEVFGEDHILQGEDGKWRMVGFHNIVDHVCAFQQWYIGEEAPHLDELGCKYLMVIGLDLGIWKFGKDAYVVVDEKKYVMSSMPSQDIIDMLNTERTAALSDHATFTEWLKKIKKHIKEFKLDMIRDKDKIVTYAQTTKASLLLHE